MSKAGISTIWANDPRPRLSVSINITGLYSGLVSKIFQKNGFPKTQAGRHDGSFLAVRTRDSNQGRPRTHTEPKISPGYHTLAASKCSQSSAAWYLPLHEHARGRNLYSFPKKPFSNEIWRRAATDAPCQSEPGIQIKAAQGSGLLKSQSRIFSRRLQSGLLRISPR